jgi:hypothetical protein
MVLYNARFNIMPHKKTSLSAAGRRWVRLARLFTGPQVIFWFEKVVPTIESSTTEGVCERRKRCPRLP